MIVFLQRTLCSEPCPPNLTFRLARTCTSTRCGSTASVSRQPAYSAGHPTPDILASIRDVLGGQYDTASGLPRGVPSVHRLPMLFGTSAAVCASVSVSRTVLLQTIRGPLLITTRSSYHLALAFPGRTSGCTCYASLRRQHTARDKVVSHGRYTCGSSHETLLCMRLNAKTREVWLVLCRSGNEACLPRLLHLFGSVGTIGPIRSRGRFGEMRYTCISASTSVDDWYHLPPLLALVLFVHQLRLPPSISIEHILDSDHGIRDTWWVPDRHTALSRPQNDGLFRPYHQRTISSITSQVLGFCQPEAVK